MSQIKIILAALHIKSSLDKTAEQIKTKQGWGGILANEKVYIEDSYIKLYILRISHYLCSRNLTIDCMMLITILLTPK
ncbi:MAG: hypothetical protein J6Y78_03600 [Paludibacteraceae bacterium]|nr:hypothetical protein [Paludibacteraceae bacterium]